MRVTIAATTALLAAVLSSLLVQGASVPQSPFSLDQPTSFPSHPSVAKWTLPRHSTNSAIVFDKYSLALAGGRQRIFIFAAEFHPWRLPSPSLWRDVLQKIRAAGFNTVSIYTHWGLIQPNPHPSSIYLTGVNDLDFFLTVAKEEGLFVIVRPGPYINAETTVGGMAAWTVNLDAVLRTNDTAWGDAWKPYIQAVSRVVVKHQLVYKGEKLGGGSVIMVQADNEYTSGPAERAYMKELIHFLKQAGISVPISYNDPGRDSNFVDLVDLYGLDSYPQRFDCSHPSTWVPFRPDYLQYHLDTNPQQPFYIPEFQGGSYDPYGGPGYEQCGQMTNASFTRVANQALVAQRVTLLSLYMVYGGTNWGGLAEPDVYTSYDYGAAISEHRQIGGEKYAELKRQGWFFSTFPDLAATEQVLDGPGIKLSQTSDLDSGESVEKELLRTSVLENPETASKFYIVRYDDTRESRRVRFALEIESLGERILVGRKLGDDVEKNLGTNHLDGRDSHIIPVDQKLPGGLLLRYTTANVYRVVTIDNLVVISLDCHPGQLLEYSLTNQDAGNYFVSMELLTTTTSGVFVKAEGEEWERAKSFHSNLAETPRVASGSMPAFQAEDKESKHMVYKTAAGTYVVISFGPTSSTASDFAAPARYTSPSSLITSSQHLVQQFFDYSNDHVILLRVDLLRNATYSTTTAPLDTLHLWGSVSKSGDAYLMALPSLKHVYWNGEKVEARQDANVEWFYMLPLPGPSDAALTWEPPKMAALDWRWSDSIPESSPSFDDSDWISANKTSSPNPYTKDPTLDTNGVILFASEYGFHSNNIVWRAHFNIPSPSPTDLFVKVEGGRSFAFSVWLNGVYLGSAEAGRENSAAASSFTIPKDLLKGGEEGVVTVLQDHMGIEMEAGQLPIGFKPDAPKRALEAVKLPRGIVGSHFPSLRAASLPEPKVEWKVQGNFRGEDAPDKVRRSLNEGGLHAEVQGWHLPGYNASSWPQVGEGKRGRVVFYRTTFSLDVPKDADLGLTFSFKKKGGRRFRAQLYVNGWQMGKYVNNLGPQREFPVHDGVVNLRGKNEVGVSVWDMGEEDEGEGEGWEWDPRRDLGLVVNHVMSGESRDGYVLEAAGWEELRG